MSDNTDCTIEVGASTHHTVIQLSVLGVQMGRGCWRLGAGVDLNEDGLVFIVVLFSGPWRRLESATRWEHRFVF
jgi:hypothetical protein